MPDHGKDEFWKNKSGISIQPIHECVFCEGGGCTICYQKRIEKLTVYRKIADTGIGVVSVLLNDGRFAEARSEMDKLIRFLDRSDSTIIV